MTLTQDSQTILVTGGAGYIGSHCCKALKKAGFNPVVFDNLSTGHREFVKWGPLEVGDLKNPQDLAQAFEKHHPSAVIHFAGAAYVGESMENPAKYYANNVVGSFNLLEAMKSAHCHTLVFSSTCAVYGEPKVLPIKEEMTANPMNVYGASKLNVEKMMASYAQAYNFKTTALRYFNAAGNDADGEIGEIHEPETHLIPLVLMATSQANGPIQIFGTDYPTKDGTCVRDYVHVSDLAYAHLQALQFLKNEKAGHHVFNLGTGRGFSVKEVITTAEKVTDRKVPSQISGRRPGDPHTLVADSSKAQKVLGWKPVFTDLETQIRHAWNWMQKRQL